MWLQNNQKSIDGSTQPGETFRNSQYVFSLWLQTLSPRKGEETLQVHLNIKRKNKNQARLDCFETDCKKKKGILWRNGSQQSSLQTMWLFFFNKKNHESSHKNNTRRSVIVLQSVWFQILNKAKPGRPHSFQSWQWSI